MVIRNPAEKLAGFVGRSLGGPRATGAGDNPILSLAVGVATTWVARRILPGRVVGLAAALAAGYITTKLTQRAERMAEQKAAQEAAAARPRSRKSTNPVPRRAANATDAKPAAAAARPRRRPSRSTTTTPPKKAPPTAE
jgi:hypothetical protein